MKRRRADAEKVKRSEGSYIVTFIYVGMHVGTVHMRNWLRWILFKSGEKSDFLIKLPGQM